MNHYGVLAYCEGNMDLCSVSPSGLWA